MHRGKADGRCPRAGQASFQRQSRAGYQPRALQRRARPGTSHRRRCVSCRLAGVSRPWRLPRSAVSAPGLGGCQPCAARRQSGQGRRPARPADPDRQRKPQVHQADQGVRDGTRIPARVTCPRLQHRPGLVLSQRGFQVPIADRQGHQFHCFHWPAGSRRRDGIGHLRTSVHVLAASRRPGRARRSAAALASQPAQGGTGWHRGKHQGIGVRNCPPAAGTAPWSRPLGARRLGLAAAERVPGNGAQSRRGAPSSSSAPGGRSRLAAPTQQKSKLRATP